MRATYSPEDNKIRLYPEGTRVDSVLDDDEYARFKAAGFKWAGKQECFVCPRWTPTAEDWAIELSDSGELDDEDYSPEERSADRAERFGDYRDKRANEAGARADTFDAGPSAFGHQNRARAERQARRHDRHRTAAVSQWSKAEYWQERTAGVIAHALHRSSAPVRRGRIKRLETEQRQHLESVAENVRRFEQWAEIPSMEGADAQIPEDGENLTPAQAAAYELGNRGSYWKAYHPTNTAANDKAREIWNHGFSVYDLLTKTEFVGIQFDRLTPRQMSELYLNTTQNPRDEDHSNNRWSRNLAFRLEYERAMLANEGGAASEADMIPGGFIYSHQIQRVHKSPATGRVTSVVVLTDERNERRINIERLPESAYRAPGPEELARFDQEHKARKAEERKTAPKAPPLINPTDEDAQKLQDLLNADNRIPSEPCRMTQAQYSARSKGNYSPCSTIGINEKLYEHRDHWNGANGLRVMFNVRTLSCQQLYGAPHVVILTDKPQKTIPWKEVEEFRATLPTLPQMTARLDEIAAALGALSSWTSTATEEQHQLLRDAAYVGLVHKPSHSQASWTEEGRAAYCNRQREPQPAAQAAEPAELVAASQLF